MIDYKLYIKEVKNFPKEGVVFQDLSTLIENGKIFQSAIQEMAEQYKDRTIYPKIDKVVGIESRGFLLAAPIAIAMNSGLIMARKKGKLPGDVIEESYSLEYGESILEMQKNSIKNGENILIVDDLLATGGTVSAAIKLIEKLNGNIVGVCFLIELENLKGREKINYPIYSLTKY
ncbi:MAG: adenine phosphoribosyltransferase [Methanogenium sp.]|jgi:adenine phosphoribosyltransferase